MIGNFLCLHPMCTWEGKTGTIWQSRVCHENRHFGGETSQILAGESTKVRQILGVPNPGKQSIWRQCPSSARKRSTKQMPNRPVFYPHVPPPPPTTNYYENNSLGAFVPNSEGIPRPRTRGSSGKEDFYKDLQV